MKTLARGCPVCGSGCGEVLHHMGFAVFDDYPLPSEYDVVVCPGCAMVFADTPASQADYDRYYSESSIYQDATISSRGGTQEWEERRQAALAERLFPLTPSRQARILEIGCANGGLLQRFRDAGYGNVAGVDPSPECVARARERGVDAWCGWLSAMPAETGACDLVILYTVLEHVLDVRGAIQSAISALAPKGRLFVGVPDAGAYADHLRTPFQDFNTEHINHFSPRGLDVLMAQFGFRCCRRERPVLRGVDGAGFPVLEAAYERTEGAAGEPGRGIETEIRRYIDLSSAVMNRLKEQIAAVVARSPELIGWGTGQLAMKLLREPPLADARMVAWVDGNTVHHGRTLRGVPVMAPEKLVPPDVPVLVTSLLHGDAIERRIRKLGWENEVVRLS